MVEPQVLATWLTPTTLFVLLNIVVVAIFLNHHSKNNKNNNNTHHHHHHNAAAAVSSTASQPQLLRAPSLFSRVASFNFSHYYHSEDSHVATYPDTAVSSAATVAVNHPPKVATVARAPSLLCRVTSFKFGWTNPQEQVESEGKKVNEHEEKNKIPREGKKVSEQEEKIPREVHVSRESEEKVEVVKVKKAVRKKKVVKKEGVADAAKGEPKTTAFKKGDEEEVDTKADDFINKFKQQLKLQRIESLLRYRSNNNATTA